MASRPTTSTHWALCSRGSRWALSSSFRLWILPAWWDGTHTHAHTRTTGNAWERGSFTNTNSDWLHGSHLETVSSCIPAFFFFWRRDQRSVVELGRGAQPALGHVDYKSWCSFPSSPRWPLRIQTPNWTLYVSHFPIFSWPDLRYYLAGPMALPSPPVAETGGNDDINRYHSNALIWSISRANTQLRQ